MILLFSNVILQHDESVSKRKKERNRKYISSMKKKSSSADIGQLANVVAIAVNIATLGELSASNDFAKTERFSQLKKMFASMRKIYDEIIFKQTQNHNATLNIENSITALDDTFKLEKFDDITAEIIARHATEVVSLLFSNELTRTSTYHDY